MFWRKRCERNIGILFYGTAVQTSILLGFVLVNIRLHSKQIAQENAHFFISQVMQDFIEDLAIKMKTG
jgi:hypothetical protein